MSFSMTGFGQSALHFGGYVIQCEVKSVNHRYSEIVIRMPREWTCYEDSLRRLVLQHVKRGRIDVYISKEREDETSPSLKLNFSAVRDYMKSAEQIIEKFGIGGMPTVAQLLALPGVMVPAESEAEGDQLGGEEWEAVLHRALGEALSGLTAMREKEGRHLAEDLSRRIEKLETIHGEMCGLAPMVVEDYRVRLKNRLTELLEGSLDEQRFNMEVAIFADRSNVDEELIRLKSHLAQSKGLLGSREPIGRKLDFLIQEMNREVNTIGSKANHLSIVNLVVEMKAELEKIREQAANLE
ncbi:YicC/YloC family endoribonuclease [Paenibacillus caui]|uniref:YicC/YloC family endoribonuclease n=1 Tax=Paenibacillus caui TaxID=2873927 RepID=UPI001CAA3710|nr:YicC/YloC family endoribonuclease [Paenibacillus caui]